MDLKALATTALGVASAFSGAVPVVGNVLQLAGLLRSLAGNLEAEPTDPATGQPMTLDEATVRLQAAIARSNAQSDTIRQNAEAALAENERLRQAGGGG